MGLITDEKLIERLCVNVTTQMRRFCKENLGNTQWPEEWLRGVERGEDIDTMPPFTQEFWWEQLNAMVPTHAPN